MPPVGFVVCDLETSRLGAPYIYDISNLRVKIYLLSTDTTKREVQINTNFFFLFGATTQRGSWPPHSRGF